MKDPMMNPNIAAKDQNHTFTIDIASLQPESTEMANSTMVPRRPSQRRSGNRKTYRQALYHGSWQEGINSPKGNLKKVQSNVNDLDRLEYSGESLRSGVQLHVMEEKKVYKRKNSIPVITSLALSDSLSQGTLGKLSRKASRDYQNMSPDEKIVLEKLFQVPATLNPKSDDAIDRPEDLHTGQRVYEAHTKTEIRNARAQVLDTLKMQVSKSITRHVNRFNAKPTVEPWDITLEKHGRHFPRILVTEEHIKNKTYFDRMKLPKISSGVNAMRTEMNILDKIADPLKKVKACIRQKALEAKKKGRKKTLQIIRRAVTQGRSVFGTTIYDCMDFCDAIDRDGDGCLDRYEIESALKRMGIVLPKKDVNAFLDMIDVNGDGDIEYEELASALNLPFDRDELEKRNDKKYNQSRKPRKVNISVSTWVPPPQGWGLVSEGSKIVL